MKYQVLDLDPGSDVLNCWQYQDADDREAFAANNCERILADWERTSSEWVKSTESDLNPAQKEVFVLGRFIADIGLVGIGIVVWYRHRKYGCLPLI